MGTVDDNGRPQASADVIQIFLANDVAKNVRVDSKTTIQVLFMINYSVFEILAHNKCAS